MRRSSGSFLGAALVAVAVVGWPCSTEAESSRRYPRAEAASNVAPVETTGLVLGEYAIDGASAVVDGDTIKVNGLDASLRLLAIDTEETFKRDEERGRYASRTFDEYRKLLRGRSPRPVKMATPLGEQAKRFARQFFEGVTRVRLERDHPGELRDFYGRHLAYVFAEKNGEWVHYNLEAVKAGMSPYFVKYGRSRRFHAELVLAHQKAREAKLGIWNPGAEAYGDYDERLRWWTARGDAIFAFETEMASKDNFIALTRNDALQTLERRIGEEVVLLAPVGGIRRRAKGPTVVRLARTRTEGFDVVFFDREVFEASKIAECVGELVRVRGRVTWWTRKGKNGAEGRGRLQIVVSDPEQVTVPTERSAEVPDPDASSDDGP